LRVYKFLSAKWGLKALEHKRLKISLFEELNDPYEGKCVHFRTRVERRAWSQAHSWLSSKHGLLCFSKNWENPVIWAHYSDMHRGLCLGFDIPNNDLAQVVEYKDKLLDASNFSSWTNDAKLELLKKIYSTKFSHWQYEAEVRYFCNLSEKDTETQNYFIDFSNELSLKEVIFGARFDGDAREVRRAVIDNSSLTFTTARLAFKKFLVTPQRAKKRQL
jgi:hypothetical protein